MPQWLVIGMIIVVTGSGTCGFFVYLSTKRTNTHPRAAIAQFYQSLYAY